MKIIFSGTPEFSIPSLEYIHKNHDLLGIITQPDRPSGRRLKVTYPAVKKYALDNQIEYFQPIDLRDPVFIKKIQNIQPDFIISVSGRILPEELIKIPENACINIHPSLLPGYKGPCPIRWVLINGESLTGVSSHIITNDIDSGRIIFQDKLDLFSDITYEILYSQLSLLTAQIIKIAMEKYLKNDFIRNIQDKYKVKKFYARKFNKEDSYIDWKKNSLSIFNLIKGLKNKPTAQTFYKNIPIKIYKAEILNDFQAENTFQPGEIANAGRKNGIIIKTGDGFLNIIELQRQNKKRLHFKDFLNGINLSIREKFQYVEN